MNESSLPQSQLSEVRAKLPGVWFGGTLPKLAQRADRLAVVRSFATNDGSHNHLPILTGRHASGAAMGAMCALGTGSFHPLTGVPMNAVVVPEAVQPGLDLGTPTPTFGLPRIRQQVAGAGSLGSQCQGMVMDGSPGQLSNFDLKLPRDRFVDRFQLKGKLDGLKHQLDRAGKVNEMNQVERQAYDLLLRGVSDAFDLSKEDPRTIAKYDTSHLFHMANNPSTLVCMQTLGAQMDHAVAAFLHDVEERGLSDKILLVIPGEMGRSPIKKNRDAGTEHHGDLTPLLLAGGGLNMGQVIGQSDRTGHRPITEPYGPENLLATVLHTMFDAAQLRVAPDLLPPEVSKAALDSQPIKELF